MKRKVFVFYFCGSELTIWSRFTSGRSNTNFGDRRIHHVFINPFTIQNHNFSHLIPHMLQKHSLICIYNSITGGQMI